MSVFGEIKEVITFLQKLDNFDMANKIIDVQTKMLEMQDELMSLREENLKLKENQKVVENIRRFPNDTIITLGDNDDILYCSKCWDDDKKLIQVTRDDDYYSCPKCKNHNMFFERSKYWERMNENIDQDIV